MQTILGSSGPIGIELARSLPAFSPAIRLVSRHPVRVNPTDELMAADLLDTASVRRAIQGSTIAYVTIGFPYETKVYRESWLKFSADVIAACIEFDCKLVFFDNVYMYDAGHLDGMTEETPVNPPSEKGQVRAEVAKRVMDAVNEGGLTALIARCAFFYGPNIRNTSKITELIFKPFSQGRKAKVLGSDACKMSVTYTPDAARAMALLGNTPDAYNQVWHLPTAPNPPTGKEWVGLIASSMGVEPNYTVLPRYLLRILGLFSPIAREMVEMVYQHDRNYVFDSSKFDRRFGVQPTPYAEGIRAIARQEFGKSETNYRS